MCRDNRVIVKKQNTIKPVVCICEINGTVGVVLRRDYDTASQEYWRKIREVGEKKNGRTDASQPVYLRVKPVFVFKAKSSNLERIKSMCHVEGAYFRVPMVPHSDVNDMPVALEYLFKPESLEPPTGVRYVSGAKLIVGCTVKVIDVESGKSIADAEVVELELDSNGIYEEVLLTSRAGTRNELAYFPGEGVWKVLSEDPMDSGRCFSQRHAGYYLEVQTSSRTDWKQMTEEVAFLIERLRQKPAPLRLGHQLSYIGILNAYREGDITFDQTVTELKKTKR